MKILITGATGFIGKNLIQRLSKQHELHLLVRPSTNYASLTIKHIFVFNENIESLSCYLKSNHIDGVIHLASFYVAEHNSSHIKDIILSNIYLGTCILEACKIAGTRWFLNTGSIWQNFNVPDFTDKYNPVNLYAASKQAFITMAKYYTQTSPIRFCTLKLCDTYGPNDTRRKIYALFEQIAKTGETLDMSPGEQLIDIVHVDKVTEAFEKLANMLQQGKEEILPEYVVSSGEQISLRQLAKKYEHEHNVKLKINWGGKEYRDREVMKPYIGYSLL